MECTNINADRGPFKLSLDGELTQKNFIMVLEDETEDPAPFRENTFI
jgi:hypothetical protein